MEEFWAARDLQLKATAEEKARKAVTELDKIAEEKFVDQQRRTWAQVEEALEYMGTPFTQGTRRSPTREIGERVLGAALKWWRKVFLRIHPDKTKVSPLASEVTEAQMHRVGEAGDTLKHARQHGWWATDRDRGRLAVLARNARDEGGLPWEPRDGTMPPRPDFIDELLRAHYGEKHSGEGEL